MDPMDPSISFDDDEGDNLGYNSEFELLEHDGDTCGINEVLLVTYLSHSDDTSSDSIGRSKTIKSINLAVP